MTSSPTSSFSRDEVSPGVFRSDLVPDRPPLRGRDEVTSPRPRSTKTRDEVTAETRIVVHCGVAQPYTPGAACTICGEWLKP